MNQNSVIAFALIAGFVVFITVKGELPAYLAVVGLGSGSIPTGTSSTGILPGITTGPSLGGVLGTGSPISTPSTNSGSPTTTWDPYGGLAL